MTKEEVIKLATPYQWLGSIPGTLTEGWTFNTVEELLAFANAIADAQREKDAQIADSALIPVITTCEQVSLARGEIVGAIRANK